MDKDKIYLEGEALLDGLAKDPSSKDAWLSGFFNQWFRLNTLYDIKDRYGKQVQFKPNLEQTKYYRESHDRDLILKARQLGFTTFKQILELITAYSLRIIAQHVLLRT